MDLDNPSYFSMMADSSQTYGNSASSASRRTGNLDSLSSASDCSLSRQLTPPRNQKRNNGSSLRTFLRSVSSNSADSNQELLIMGEPRASDIAPEIKQKTGTTQRSNSLKSKPTEKIQNDLVYSALPTSEEEASASTMAACSSQDEVFVEVDKDSARYYNINRGPIPGTDPNQRRHSFGTFFGTTSGSRERSSSVTSSRSFKDDFSQQAAMMASQGIIHATSDGDSVAGPGASVNFVVDDHALRHASYPRKRCPRCSRGAVKKPTNMDDILIVSLKSSETSTLWVEYFSSYFQQISKQANRKPFKIQYLWAEDCIAESQEQAKQTAEKASGVKLQLVVLCPGFLEFISEYPAKCNNLGRLFLADRTLALLLGVTDDDLNETHKKVLPTYLQWQRLSVGQDQDANFTKEFLGQAMAILSRVWKQQSSISSQEKSCFSVSPKKIRQGQNSVFILLTYPLQKEDTVKVSIERNNELFEVKSVKRRNPYTIKIAVPDNLTEITAIVNILVEKNGSIVGSRPIKCESRLRELEQILRFTDNPVEFMCQTLGFNPANKEHLDNWLLHAFQRNLPTHFNLLANHATPFAAAVHVHKHSHEEYPTLLHFAAKFGFEKLALQLLDCPGADVAYDIKNCYDLTPAEIAESNGHPDLAATLRGYMNMNEFSNMYTKLKELSASKIVTVDEDSYLTPKAIEDFYKICPAPRPVRPESSNSNVTTPMSECSLASGYLAMKTPVSILVDTSHENLGPSQQQQQQTKEQTKQQMPTSPKKFLNSTEQLFFHHHQHQQKSKNFLEVTEDAVQQELVEIMNDFKNNVHSITQVEKLVEEWKNRNDVQKSFKEKQDQLNEMRMKYEKIQHEMKAQMKKSTPFERVKKLFARSKSREDKQQNISLPTLTSPSIVAIQSQRPISSLSTSSSGSSGRMSTISGCSVGDSGTHSDNEERKHMLGHDDDFRSELSKAVLELNYTPVPVPKPVKGGLFLNRNKLFETIEEKPVPRPDTLALSEEYYIQFPPSGLPLPGVVDKKSPAQEYMNVNPFDAASPENREYMNFKVVT